MRQQSDAALAAAFEKLFGSSNQIVRSSLLRKLENTPEFFYYASEMIEEALARGILRIVPQPPQHNAEPHANERLEFVDDPGRDSTLPSAARVR
jgi:hypothetical protein